MFSFGCCGNVLKQIIDISNLPVDLSNIVLEISKTMIDISNVVTDISNVILNKEEILEKCDCLIFERNVEPLLDASNVQIHVVDAMKIFLNETIDNIDLEGQGQGQGQGQGEKEKEKNE